MHPPPLKKILDPPLPARLERFETFVALAETGVTAQLTERRLALSDGICIPNFDDIDIVVMTSLNLSKA